MGQKGTGSKNGSKKVKKWPKRSFLALFSQKMGFWAIPGSENVKKERKTPYVGSKKALQLPGGIMRGKSSKNLKIPRIIPPWSQICQGPARFSPF
jgi:hypothetical protein